MAAMAYELTHEQRDKIKAYVPLFQEYQESAQAEKDREGKMGQGRAGAYLTIRTYGFLSALSLPLM